MINNIKKSKFPNNLYLEINGVGWKHSDEIMALTQDHTIGAYVVIEILSYRDSNDILRERFINLKTNEEIAETTGLSTSKVSKAISSYISEIKETEKFKNFILKGYNYYKTKM